MERATQKIVALIEHLRLESLNEQHKCFYCGSHHRTVDCTSAKRNAFYKILRKIAADFQGISYSESEAIDQDCCFDDMCCVDIQMNSYLEREYEFYD